MFNSSLNFQLLFLLFFQSFLVQFLLGSGSFDIGSLSSRFSFFFSLPSLLLQLLSFCLGNDGCLSGSLSFDSIFIIISINLSVSTSNSLLLLFLVTLLSFTLAGYLNNRLWNLRGISWLYWGNRWNNFWSWFFLLGHHLSRSFIG